MNKSVEFCTIDIHDPDELALFGHKLIVEDGVEKIVEMSDEEIEAYCGAPIPDQFRDTPRAKDGKDEKP